MRKSGVERFFAFARERHTVYLKKSAGQERPWTTDKILQRYKFTNVFRELDRTTAWFRRYVRDPLQKKPEVLLATVVFRMLNRVATGEAIFCQNSLTNERDLNTAFEKFVSDGHTGHLKHDIKTYVGKKGPYVTGAYIISSPPGYAKLDGVLKILGDFARKKCENGHCGYADWECVARRLIAEPGEHTLESVWRWLKEFPYLGSFHSFEIVTDLRHTDLLSRAPDIMTWANIGPGCRRGVNRVMGRDKKDHSLSDEQILEEMRELLEFSRSPKHWPQPHGDCLRCDYDVFLHSGSAPAKQWPEWEMRECEHLSCEFDKMERVRLDEGRPRGIYR